MNKEDQVSHLNMTIEQAKVLMKRRDALRALEKNKDWQTLITECYFKTEPVRLVMLKADVNAQTPEMQEAIDKDITSIGNLRQFFAAVIQLGENAESSLEEHRKALDELQDESLDDVDEFGE